MGSMPVRWRLILYALISRSVRGAARHWLLFLVKICMASQPTSSPRRKALSTPPAMDMCAPRRGPPAPPFGRAGFLFFRTCVIAVLGALDFGLSTLDVGLRTPPEHPQPAEGEVVFDRIRRVELFQVLGDFEGHGQAWALHPGQAEPP